MVYEEHKWFELKRTGIKFELVIRDEDFKKIDTIRFSSNKFIKTMKDIGSRYGIEDCMQKPNKEIQDEIDWLKKESIIN